MSKPDCLVIGAGAGAGIGGHVAKRFAHGGFHACLARRTDGQGLDRLVREITDAGDSASGFMLNAVEDGSIETLVEKIESDIGPIEVAVDNLNAQIGDRALAETSLKAFETGWRMATFGLFRLASCLLPRMAQRGRGTLSQTLNAEFAAKGIHVAHIVIDGLVDAPDTLGKMLGPERFESLRERKGLEKDGLLVLAAIAETYYHLATQHRSAWTFELELRAHSDVAWWNHASLSL